MAKNDLTQKIKQYLSEDPDITKKDKKETQEKRRFVTSIARLIESQEVMELMGKVHRPLKIISEMPPAYNPGGWRTDFTPAYAVYTINNILIVTVRNSIEQAYTLPTDTANWMNAIPYGGQFSWSHDEPYKPRLKWIKDHIENQIKGMIE
ncbi:hypothetical protein ACFL96_10705 [Thermoproteota archaeon]